VTCEQFTLALSTADLDQVEQLIHQHAQTCEDCRALWHLDQRLHATGRSVPQLSMSVELRQLLLAHQGPTRSSTPSKRLASILAPFAACLGVALLVVPRADLSKGLSLAFWSGAMLLCASLAAAVQVYLHRDASGSGAPAFLRWTVVLGVLAIFQGFALLEVFHGPHDPSVNPRRDCLLLGLLVAFSVGAAALAAARRSVLLAPGASGALAGCIGGLSAVAFLHVHCAASAGHHLALVHGLPLAIAVLAGVGLGRRVLSAG
jgi:hypothetical protein